MYCRHDREILERLADQVKRLSVATDWPIEDTVIVLESLVKKAVWRINNKEDE